LDNEQEDQGKENPCNQSQQNKKCKDKRAFGIIVASYVRVISLAVSPLQMRIL
jgi:hypothetical protein